MPKVLIVDDDSQFRRVVRIALMAHGHEVNEAANGQEALDKMNARTPDVVLLDWRMPVMNGEESCRAIRAACAVPIIVVSALNRGNEALSVGANGFLSKPVDVGALLAGIEVCTGGGQVYAPAENPDVGGRDTPMDHATQMAPENRLRQCSAVPAPQARAAGAAGSSWEGGEAAAPPAAAPARILVVDDDPMIRTLIERILESERFDVTTAEDGYCGIELFRRYADISVVILDWQMPGISGERVFDEFAAIRPDIKVIVASGESPVEVQRAFSGRNVRFLAKPFKIHALVAAVKFALAGGSACAGLVRKTQ